MGEVLQVQHFEPVMAYAAEGAGHSVRAVGVGADISDMQTYLRYMQLRGQVYGALKWIDVTQRTETGAELPDGHDLEALHLAYKDEDGQVVGTTRLVASDGERGMPLQQYFDVQPRAVGIETSRIIAFAPHDRPLQRRVASELIGIAVRHGKLTGQQMYGMQEEITVPMYANKGLVLEPLANPQPVPELGGTVNAPYELNVEASLDVDAALTEEQYANRVLWNEMLTEVVEVEA